MNGFWVAVSAAICFLLGIYLGRRMARTKPVIETWTEVDGNARPEQRKGA